MSAESASNSKQVKFIKGSTDVLVIAPHGVNVPGVNRDDSRADLVAAAIAEELGCSALINDCFKRTIRDYNTRNGAEQDKEFIGKLKSVLDADGYTLILWIHGYNEKKRLGLEKELKVKGSLDCIVGYGQGEPNRPTATKKTREKLISVLADHGIEAYFAVQSEECRQYCGHSLTNMNQWCRLQPEYKNKSKVESIQLEFKEPGFRQSDDEARQLGIRVANAIKAMVRPIVQKPDEALKETGPIEMANDAVNAPIDAESVQRDAEARAADALVNQEVDRQDTSEAEFIDGEATSIEPVNNEKPSTIQVTDTSDITEDKKVAKAFERLKSIFHKHFHNAMVEAGQYIIATFYDSDPIAALAKNSGKEQPQSIKNLIDMLRKASEQPKGNVPSLAWFYNAVNLAAHEAICEQKGFQTFRKLGHSHKLQLLHVPKLKGIPAADIKKDLSDIFEEKEQLAEYAFNKKELSVRDFRKYIKEQRAGSDEIDLAELPPLQDLKSLKRSDLVKLRNKAKGKIEANQRLIAMYGKSIQKLDTVLAEPGKGSANEKKRHQDWTKPENNINICNGCENDCLYCYSKSMAQRWKQVKSGEWPQMQIRQPDVDKPRKLHDDLVGFPTSHDITPTNIDAYLIVLGKLLRAGNEVLIITKPRFDCVKAICDASPFFKDKILFRFTIGAMDNDILRFWEPNAPNYEERKECLRFANEHGFRTSVSMEPMLDTVEIEQMIEDLRPFVTKDIWLGTMNHLKAISTGADEDLKAEIAKVEAGQSPEILVALYNTYQNDSLIKWKSDAWKIIQNAINRQFDGWEKVKIKNDSNVEVEAIAPVIISATRRSDIPAWHSDWFMERLRRGHLLSTHIQWQYVSFEKTRVIVFWTKNPQPIIKYLNELDDMNIGYYFTYTLTDYDEEGLEPNLPPLQERLDTFRELSGRISKEKVIWRFDPLVLTDTIDRDRLIGKVGHVMENLSGHTEKLVFSFFNPTDHKKVQRNLKKAGISAQEFSAEDKVYVAQHIVDMGKAHNIQTAACSEAMDLSLYGVAKNKCIDDDLMRRLFGGDKELISFLDQVKGKKHKGQREQCNCIKSFDVGVNNTCRNGCIYCYANVSQKAVENNFWRLSNDGEALLGLLQD